MHGVLNHLKGHVDVKEYPLGSIQHIYKVDGQYLIMVRYSKKSRDGHYNFSVPFVFISTQTMKYALLICEKADNVIVMPASLLNDVLEDVEPQEQVWTLDVFEGRDGLELRVERSDKVLYVDSYVNDYDLLFARSAAHTAGITAISIICENRTGVLRDISGLTAKYEGNITFTQLFVLERGQYQGKSSLYMEVEGVSDIDLLISAISKLHSVVKVDTHAPLQKIYGKRVIIIGGGAQVAQVAMGAINEADRHNIRGERISVDTMPVVGEANLADSVEAVSRLHRAEVLVLAGSLMGGRITEEVKRLRAQGIPVISLNMAGSVPDHSDLVVNDPIQAGTFAVMHVAKTAVFDIGRVRGRRF